jgi:iron complex transport system substrate-binding protein
MKNKRITPLPLLFLILCLALAACSPASTPTPEQSAPPTAPAATTPTEEPQAPEPAETEPPAGPASELTFTDGLGRTVTLAGPAQRIVSLAPSNAELLFAVGAGAQVVGVDEFTNYPEEAKALTKIGGSFGEFNTETIVSLQPDLVLASELNPPELVTTLENLGLTVYYLSNPVELQGVYDNLRIVGELTGHLDEAEALVASLEQRVAAVLEKTAGVTERPKVFYELDASDPDAPYTTGPGTFMDSLIQMAGGQNVAAVVDTPWAQLSSEEILVQNPDIILLGDAAYGITPESVAARPGWENINAVKNGQIHPFNDDWASRPGPRLVDALEALVELLHPELGG